MSKDKDAIILKYIGQPGAHIANVPARNLTQADIDNLKLKPDALVKSGLYQTIPPVKQAAKEEPQK